MMTRKTNRLLTDTIEEALNQAAEQQLDPGATATKIKYLIDLFGFRVSSNGDVADAVQGARRARFIKRAGYSLKAAVGLSRLIS